MSKNLLITASVSMLWLLACMTFAATLTSTESYSPLIQLAGLVSAVVCPLLFILQINQFISTQQLQQQIADLTQQLQSLHEQHTALSATEHPVANKPGKTDEIAALPDFVHQSTHVTAQWIEMTFHNQGGKAAYLDAITEGDTATEVHPQLDIKPGETVAIKLQPVGGSEQSFRFCLNSRSPDSTVEQQQFFRYSSEQIEIIDKPSIDQPESIR